MPDCEVLSFYYCNDFLQTFSQNLRRRLPAAAIVSETRYFGSKSTDNDDDEIFGLAGGDSAPKPHLDTRLPGSSSQSIVLNQLSGMSDEEVVQLVRDKKVSQYALEKEIKKAVDKGLSPDCARAVRIRRLFLGQDVEEKHGSLPFTEFNYESFYREVLGKACENVIGYVPIPVGFAGPLKVSSAFKQDAPSVSSSFRLLVADLN